MEKLTKTLINNTLQHDLKLKTGLSKLKDI